MIAYGANVNLQDIHGRIPMFVAMVAKHPKIARRLADAQPDTSICTNDGSTLLMAALETEDVVLVQWALDHGVDVNALRPEEDHATALMIAASDGNLDMVKKLLDHGANPDEANHNGDTALDLAKGRDVKELLRTRGKVLIKLVFREILQQDLYKGQYLMEDFEKHYCVQSESQIKNHQRGGLGWLIAGVRENEVQAKVMNRQISELN